MTSNRTLFNTIASIDMLHFAASENDIAAIDIFMATANANIDARDKNGLTPLMTAARNGNIEFARALLAKGADIHATDKAGGSVLQHVFPLQKLAQKLTSEPAFVELLLDNQAVVSAVAGLRPENMAVIAGVVIRKGMTEVLEAMISNGLDIDSRTHEEMPLLLAAADAGSKGMVALLLARGANVNATHPNGRSPLRAAMAGDRLDLVEMLLAGNADPGIIMPGSNNGLNMSDRSFSTMCDFEIAVAVAEAARKFEVNEAAIRGDAATVEKLLKEGVTPDAIDRTGNSPVLHAIDNDKPDVLKVLVAGRANLHLQPAGKKLPLHAAIKKGALDATQILLEAGVSAILKSRNNHDALDVARRSSKKGMLALVEPYYAREKGIAVKQAIGLSGSVAAPQTARFRKGPAP
jgi:ankyrin repeat protein